MGSYLLIRLWVLMGFAGAAVCAAVAYAGRNCGLDEHGIPTGDACHPKYSLARLLLIPCLAAMTVAILAIKSERDEQQSAGKKLRKT